MLTHGGIWSAIDALADRYGYSPSGLAKRSGLDSTAFNKSKRFSPDGRPRWPSTESLSKILAATGATPAEFLRYSKADTDAVAAKTAPPRPIPLIGFAEAGKGGYFDDAGFPAGDGWEQIEVPGRVSSSAYALRVHGDSMLPLYQDGGILVVDPETTIRRGDRIVARTQDGEVMVKTLQRKSSTAVELLSLNPEHPPRKFDPRQIEWMARVVWASQ